MIDREGERVCFYIKDTFSFQNSLDLNSLIYFFFSGVSVPTKMM